MSKKTSDKSGEKKPGRARETGATRTFNFEITPALDDALEATARKQMRTKRAVVILALKAYMAQAGTWTEPPEQ